MPDVLERIPESFVKGDTVEWSETVPDFSSDTYDMVLTFAPADTTAGAAIQIASSGGSPAITKNADGSFTPKISGATSTSFTAGTVYHWQKQLTDGTDKYTVESGRILVRTSLAVLNSAGGTHDVRSAVKKTLDQIRDRITGRSLLDQNSMSIGNRAVSRMNMDELVKWEAVYSAKYEDEVRRERMRRGLRTSRSVKVRFR
jgi:hypothetical protein